MTADGGPGYRAGTVMGFEVSRLRRGEVIAAAGGALLLIAMFTGWYGLEIKLLPVTSITVPLPSTDAWNAFTVIDIFLAVTAGSALALAYTQASRRSPAVPVSFSVVTTVLGAISVLLILFRIIDPPGVDFQPTTGFSAAQISAVTQHLSRTVDAGAWFGLVSAAVITVGAWISLRAEGVAPADEYAEIETLPAPSAPSRE